MATSDKEWEWLAENICLHTKSGLKILHEPCQNPISKVTVCIKTPTNNDYGAPHALEHLVFFGSKRNPYRGYLDEFAVNHFCNEINATTKTDHTCFTFDGLWSERQNVEKVVSELLEHLLEPELPKDAFKSEIFDKSTNSGVMYFELTEREYDLKLLSDTESRKVLYSKPISANSISSGTAKNLRNGSLQFEDIKNYHKSHYKPYNTAIIVQGKIDMECLQEFLDEKLQDKPYTPSPKTQIDVGKIKKDALKEMTAPSMEDELLLICAWEIRIELMDATKVLLEFFKKNNSVLFSRFSYEINYFDAEFATVHVLFEDFEELDEERMCSKMKKSIAEYMNQVDKELFLQCMKNALKLTHSKSSLDQEMSLNHKKLNKLIETFLYSVNQEIQDVDLIAKDFDFWFKVAKKWARTPWAVLVMTGSRKLYEKENKHNLTKSNKSVNLLPKTPSFEEMIPFIDIPLENIISVIDLSRNEGSDNFTTLMFAYGISHLTKEDFDFLPMIEVLITKALRTTCNALRVKTLLKRESYFTLIITISHSDALETLQNLLDNTFLEECETILGKVAKAIHENLNSFDMNDVSFWRTFLRFKHYLKILKSVSNYEEKSTRTTEKVIRSMLENLVKVEVYSTEEIENQCKSLIDPIQMQASKPKNVKSNYGYGHHRINVSDEIKSSHACIMMGIPQDLNPHEVAICVEILNKVKGLLWKNIRDAGLAYGASISMDLSSNEIVIMLHDCGDVIKALSTIRNTIEQFSDEEYSIYDQNLAKKSAIIKLVRKLGTTKLTRAQNNFIEDILCKENSILSLIEKIYEANPRDFERAKKSFAKDYVNPKKLNMVIMMPKDKIASVQTLKGLVNHGFKLFI